MKHQMNILQTMKGPKQFEALFLETEQRAWGTEVVIRHQGAALLLVVNKSEEQLAHLKLDLTLHTSIVSKWTPTNW